MICFVIALACEAKPLIAHYRLRRDRSARGFSVYRDQSGSVALVVSGPGAAASAAATAYLFARLGDATVVAAWVNIGTCGHRVRPLGELLVAHQISDAASGQRWYPPLVIEPGCASVSVTTFAQAQSRYPADTAVDMEASGFYATVCRFTSAELAQVVKVISDNTQSPPSALNAVALEALISARLAQIVSIAEQTVFLANELSRLNQPPQAAAACEQRFRISVTERHQLYDRLTRWHTLYPGATLNLDEHQNIGSLIDWLSVQIR